jgi:hypothetical protein
MGSRKKALVTEEEVAGEVDALLSALGASPGATLDDDESSFDGTLARAAARPPSTGEHPAPSANLDSLWGGPGRKRR